MVECTAVIHLRQLASNQQDTAIAEAARSALRMIPDIDSPSTDLSVSRFSTPWLVQSTGRMTPAYL
jgi:hypothetical protein